MSNLQTFCHFKLDLQKLDQVVNQRYQKPQGQSFTKPGTPLQYILVGNALYIVIH